ncbi:MAG: tyrosine-type recombinase/integrase [Oscillospiraceae bacterium]
MNNITDIKLSADMTLKEWLEYWFEVYTKRTVKQSTAVSYHGYINGHIVPHIGSYKLSELNTDIFQRFFNAQSDNGSLKGGGLSPKTLSNISRMIHKSMQKALELELIKKNYVEFIELPKQEAPEMRVLTVYEQKLLMIELSHSKEKLAFGVYLSLALGIRLGEVLGLRWSDIDTKNGIVHIRRTVNRLPTLDSSAKTELVVGTPKSKKSVRDIPINDELCKEIISYNAKTNHLVYNDNYLLRSSIGGPAEPKTLQDTFKCILKDAGIADANFHSLRHTFATRAIEKGVDVKTLSVLLGHSSVNFTLDRYAHVLDRQKRETMDLLLNGIAL